MKTIALVSHDRRKADMIDWAVYNAQLLSQHHLVCTGTTGTLIKQAINKKYPELQLDIECKLSGPLGGDQQIGSMIAEGRIDLLIFLEDDLAANAHHVDINALERIARLQNVVTACNRSTADMVLSSPLFFDESYVALKPRFIDFDREAFEKELKENEESSSIHQGAEV